MEQKLPTQDVSVPVRGWELIPGARFFVLSDTGDLLKRSSIIHPNNGHSIVLFVPPEEEFLKFHNPRNFYFKMSPLGYSNLLGF